MYGLVERMAQGLGLTASEWEDLKSKVDDSFWVMRIIGMDISHVCLSLH